MRRLYWDHASFERAVSVIETGLALAAAWGLIWTLAVGWIGAELWHWGAQIAERAPGMIDASSNAIAIGQVIVALAAASLVTWVVAVCWYRRASR
jgi:hypothetical protein